MSRFCLLLILAMILTMNGALYAAEKMSSAPSDGRATKAEEPSDDLINPEVLPSIIIAYNLFSSRYTSFKSLESNPQNLLIKLEKNMDALPGGLSGRLVFVHQVFVVQNNLPDQLSGYFRVKNQTLKASQVPFESLLFVTTPIASIHNRVLAIISSVSPENTIILAVDNKLNVEVLYGPYGKYDLSNKKDIKSTPEIGSIYNVRVIKPGYFLLMEREEPQTRMPDPIRDRIFILDVTSGKFNLSLDLRTDK